MQRRRAARNLQIMWQYLDDRFCVDCKAIGPIILTFDHRDPKLKYKDVNRIAHHGESVAILLAEIDKCDVVCANCHLLRNYKRRESSGNLMA